MPDPHQEHVLVVPTEVFHRLGYFQGFTDEVERYLPELFSPRHVSYRPRRLMEQDPSFKQLIPYVIFRYRTPERTWLFQYRRGGGQGERRLHQKRSIGVGGHICRQDAQSGGEPYQEGLLRELQEEVIYPQRCRLPCVGLINDDQTDVGRVHLGVVHLADLDRPEVQAREAEMLEARFSPVEELLQDLDQFETWSQICLQALFAR